MQILGYSFLLHVNPCCFRILGIVQMLVQKKPEFAMGWGKLVRGKLEGSVYFTWDLASGAW